MIQLAIIGPTASGKSDLAIKIAKKIDAYILSIDSLSIYKEIDIVSAKPSCEELQKVKHFGIDFLNVNDYFSVDIFINLYKEVLEICKEHKKNLIIVGGTSFYLKSLIDGLSEIPKITQEQSLNVKIKLKNLQNCYDFLYSRDSEYMKNISPNDSYRIEKALLIYEGSGLTPTEYFRQNPPKPVIKNISIFNIEVQRDLLRERILSRTKKMLESGLINEVAYLEQKYTRAPHAMGSIGIVETLEYIDGFISKDEMIEKISTHTAGLAKRQQTFNKTQFENVISAPLDELEEIIYSTLRI
ncbi:MAG: tRNA (adenosine(37)-N6)-dimethylallyltransferase MiaA [Sulfurimonas sp.]|jgi:tRNA dimethylallyltransferase|uniref:tRNA (adenosine(37)-N6)-dimethylallyltransferase MiaA n=1 Tax=Sulfurimonas sp. TaxID=2022749 RepID=UPI00261A8854|nr:tRNA (adenosine(37)-N6)-dimethylallyltransferase MiaA [Sulfurimonas sp.]MDD3477117.1 tRNA (adenosine(37)-N6)-dimethylallyltransferase MiaA [Sulfurimonas sp.]